MNELSAMPSEVTEWLSEQSTLENIKFVTEFPALKKAVPLKKTTVAVGLASIKITDTFEDSEDTDILEDEENCRYAEITLRFAIHVPYSSGGEGCHTAFADIIDCLTFNSGLNIISSGCEDISEDRETDALVLNATATVSSTLCPAQSSTLTFPSFIDKTLLCGSHIRDTDIHLSSAQKSFLDAPFICGTYMGTGASENSVTLGYQPRVVIVIAGGMPVMKTGSENKMLWGVGLRNATSMGVTLTTTGFKTAQGGTAFQGAVPNLNELGVTYSYVVMK